MSVAIVHLSDIHFKEGTTPILGRSEQVAAALCSVDLTVDFYIIVISGDIAWSGETKQYDNASLFLSRLLAAIKARQPSVRIELLTVPGNHDCLLPEAEVSLRAALIAGIRPQIPRLNPDASLLGSILGPQGSYWNFSASAESTPALSEDEKVLRIRSFSLSNEHKITFLLFNTALLSTRNEEQGQLDLPLQMIRRLLPTGDEGGALISVFHHSYPWVKADTAIEFRGIVEQISDFALCGHQHFQYKSSVTTEEGTLTYLEAGALQDATYPINSQFGVILLDGELSRQRVLTYKWIRDLYRSTTDTDWMPRTFNHHSRPRFAASQSVLLRLNDPGIPRRGTTASSLTLPDIFVSPDITVKGDKGQQSLISGETALPHLMSVEFGLCNGSHRSGKSTLAAMLFLGALSSQSSVPLIISGVLILSSQPKEIDDFIKSQFIEQYDNHSFERYKQLSNNQRSLVVDDWHLTKLDKVGRASFAEHVRLFFGNVMLFCDDIFRFEDAAAGIESSPEMKECTDISIKQFGHAARGKLVDKWISIQGNKMGRSQRDVQRTIEETDRLLISVMGKNTLPSLPFIIICILQAMESEGASVPEAGSFGYLYEVLVTVALTQSKSKEPQLDKKFTFLARLAYSVLRSGNDSLSRTSLYQQIEEYSNSYKIKVNADDLVADLLFSHVLTERDGNFSFTYPHYFYYFVARHFRDQLRGMPDVEIRAIVDNMIDHIGVEENAAIIMFLVYFTKDSNILSRLIEKSDQIYSSVQPCKLEDDTRFMSELGSSRRWIEIPSATNPAETRRKRRLLRDELQKAESGRAAAISAYADDLSDGQKIRLAFRHLELLGQVIRNFPGSLPGEEKLLILDSSYRLGLRLLSALMGLLRDNLNLTKTTISGSRSDPTSEEVEEMKEIFENLEKIVKEVAEMSSFAIAKKLSACVGLPDLEDAYQEAAKMVGESTATKLVNFAIRLDHMTGFPLDELTKLYKSFQGNDLAQNTLRYLVIDYMLVVGLENHRTTQSVSALIGVNSNNPKLLIKARRR